MNHQLLVFLFISCISVKYTSLATECSRFCRCERSKMDCFKIIPSFIPSGVTEVIAYEVLLNVKLDFSGIGWENVTHLSLNPGQSVFRAMEEDFTILHDGTFIGLANLEYLQIASKHLGKIEKHAFYGLDRLKVLDLSNNEALEIYEIVEGLKEDYITPNLTELYLSNTSARSYSKFEMDNTFLTAIKTKPLKVLDLSQNRNAFFLKDRAIWTTFPTLEKLNLSDTGLAVLSLHGYFEGYFSQATSFKKLRIIDISYPLNPFQLTSTGFKRQLTEDLYFRSYLEITEIYARNVFKTETNVTGFSKPNLFCVLLFGTEQNYKFWLYGKIDIIKKLVMSENSFNYFDPRLFDGTKALRYLDFSKNKLGNVFSLNDHAQPFMDALYRLEELHLSHNGIFTLPTDIFRKSKDLQYLDLSNNKINSVTFKAEYLKSIKTIDLSNNKIIALDTVSRHRIDSLFSILKIRKMNEVEMVYINIQANPFVCSCETLNFLKWLMKFNATFLCTLEAEEKIINKYAIERSEYLCKKNIVVATFSILTLIEVIVSTLTVYFVVRERKKSLFKSKIKMAIQRYSHKRNDGPPVFLSFCSEDEQIVMNDIFPNLDAGLKRILHTDSRCIATGGTDFRPGFSIANEIIRCIENSSVIVFFVTNAFCRKMWCRNETLVAYYEHKPTVIMIMENVDVGLMPKYLHKHYQQYTRVHWRLVNGQHVMTPGFDKLCESIVSLFAENETIN